MKNLNPRGGFNPKTASRKEMSPKAPVLSNAAETSADAQKIVTRPPMPFANKNSVGQSAPGPKAPGGVSTLEPKIQSGMKRQSPGVRALPPRGPVGQKKPINQSGQVNGRMGTAFPRKQGAYPSGYPSKRNARFYGE